MSTILTEVENGVGWLVLNRPDRINSLNDELRANLPMVLRQLDQNPGVRVIVVRGNGPRGFCAGADIKEERPSETLLTLRDRMARDAWIKGFSSVRKPLIAAVHGACMGGGFEIALACDLRLASEEAVFALPEVGLGLIPGAGGTQRLSRLVGAGRAMEMVLTGWRYEARTMQSMGFLSGVSSDPETLIDDARALGMLLAAKPPASLNMAKEAVLASMELSLSAGMDLEQKLFLLCSQTEDRSEAARAFKEKRPPKFTGN